MPAIVKLGVKSQAQSVRRLSYMLVGVSPEEVLEEPDNAQHTSTLQQKARSSLFALFA